MEWQIHRLVIDEATHNHNHHVYDTRNRNSLPGHVIGPADNRRCTKKRHGGSQLRHPHPMYEPKLKAGTHLRYSL